MSEEYAVERTFTYVDWLENGDILVQTEWGSLLTESMMKDAVVAQLAKACRKLGRNQRMRIRIEVVEVDK